MELYFIKKRGTELYIHNETEDIYIIKQGNFGACLFKLLNGTKFIERLLDDTYELELYDNNNFITN